jgi:hypothetical protein
MNIASPPYSAPHHTRRTAVAALRYCRTPLLPHIAVVALCDPSRACQPPVASPCESCAQLRVCVGALACGDGVIWSRFWTSAAFVCLTKPGGGRWTYGRSGCACWCSACGSFRGRSMKAVRAVPCRPSRVTLHGGMQASGRACSWLFVVRCPVCACACMCMDVCICACVHVCVCACVHVCMCAPSRVPRAVPRCVRRPAGHGAAASSGLQGNPGAVQRLRRQRTCPRASERPCPPPPTHTHTACCGGLAGSFSGLTRAVCTNTYVVLPRWPPCAGTGWRRRAAVVLAAMPASV